MHRIFDVGDAASCFDYAHPIFKQALSISRAYNCKPVGFSDSGIVDQVLLQLTLPKFEIIGWNGLHVSGSESDGRYLLPNQACEYFGKRYRDFGQVDRLEAISVGLK